MEKQPIECKLRETRISYIESPEWIDLRQFTNSKASPTSYINQAQLTKLANKEDISVIIPWRTTCKFVWLAVIAGFDPTKDLMPRKLWGQVLMATEEVATNLRSFRNPCK